MKRSSWDIRLLCFPIRNQNRRRVITACLLIFGILAAWVLNSSLFKRNAAKEHVENPSTCTQVELPPYRVSVNDELTFQQNAKSASKPHKINEKQKADNPPATQNKEPNSKITESKSKDLKPDHVTTKTLPRQINTTTTEAPTKAHVHRERFLIYVCNVSRGCYGLGDRQRGIASAYVLACITDRTFGIIWTQPSNLTDYYLPNKVNWIIPKEKLKGKSTVTVTFVAGKSFDFLTIPFNREYPQDVVYMITNMYIVPKLTKLKTDVHKVPKNLWSVGAIWVHLMLPKSSLRNPLNAMLTEVAEEIIIDGQIQKHMNSSSCRKACNAHNLNAKSNKALPLTSDVVNCVSELNKKFEKPLKRYNITTQNYLSALCPKTKNVSVPVPSDETVKKIKQSRGWDVTNLGLVCAHVRFGRSKTLPDDVSFIKTMNGTQVYWDFLQPYVDKGRHVYLATDNEEIRTLAREKLGYRVHFSTTAVTHMDRKEVRKSSTAFAFWENMLLMTSCQTLVICNSGYGKWASSARDTLMGTKDKFIMTFGKIKKF